MIHGAAMADTWECVFIHENTYVDELTRIGAGTKFWHFVHILPNCVIGENRILGQNVMVGTDMRIGNRCKIQYNVSVYKGREPADPSTKDKGRCAIT